MHKKNILLTFDYELFLGKDSGTAENCMLKPIDSVLDIFSKYGGKGIFFIDTVYLLRLKTVDMDTYNKIKDQLLRITENGSSIELHIHPQWLDAVYQSNGRWDHTNTKLFRVHVLDDEELSKMFTDSVKLLNSITNKPVRAYRAGGWSVQPFDKLKSVLSSNGITYDFSVNPGIFIDNKPLHYYDYRKMSTINDIYRFENDPCIHDDGGSFIEVPLSKISDWKLLPFLSWKKYKKNKPFGDGKGVCCNNETTKKSTKIRLKNLFSKALVSIAPDNYENKYIKRIIKKSFDSNKKIVTAVIHPKNMNEEALRNIEYIVKNYNTMSTDDLEYFVKTLNC